MTTHKSSSYFMAVGLISISVAVLALNVNINIRNGLRLIDGMGDLANGVLVAMLSIVPAAAMAACGRLWGMRRRVLSLVAAMVTVLGVGYNFWNANEFVGDAVLAKHSQAAAQQEMSNKAADEMVRSKREAEERLWQAWRATRDPLEKAATMKQIEKVRAEVLTLTYPVEKPNSIGARSKWLAQKLGWDATSIDSVTPMIMPILMQIVELGFSFLGFSVWPQKSEAHQGSGNSVNSKLPGLPEPVSPAFSYDAARADIVHLKVTGKLDGMKLSKSALARRWGVPVSTAHDWYRRLNTEGFIDSTVGRRNTHVVRAMQLQS